MPKFITSLAWSQEFLPVWEALKKKARTEGKPLGRLVEEILLDYVNKNSMDNSQPRILKWVEDNMFLAMPTLGENPSKYSHIKDDVKGWASVRSQALKWAQHAESELRKANATETLEAKMRKETTSSLQRIAEQGGPENRVIAAAILKERVASNS